MEKPFCSGDSITKETHENSFSSMNVEDEIKLILESKQAIEDNIAGQKMKELGLERYCITYTYFIILLNKLIYITFLLKEESL